MEATEAMERETTMKMWNYTSSSGSKSTSSREVTKLFFYTLVLFRTYTLHGICEHSKIHVFFSYQMENKFLN